MSTRSSIASSDPTVVGDKASQQADEADVKYQPKSLKFWTIVISVLLSIFLVSLDRLIIATAIPAITDRFNSIQDIGWYGSAYMLTAAAFLPFFGRIYQIYSTKWVYLMSIVIFEVGSVLCAAAPNSATLIVGRAIAGLGSAGIFNGGMLVITAIVPLHKRPVFTSLFGMVFGVSSILGPVVGGAFVEHVSWRWCFWINLPLGGLTLVVVTIFLRIEPPKPEQATIYQHIKRLDPIGLVLFVSSMTCLILALQWGGTASPWSAPRIIALLVVFAVLLIAFITYEAFNPLVAMMPLRIVCQRSIAGAMLFRFLLSGGMMVMVYYLSIWFQVVKETSALHAGINTLPIVLSLIVFGLFGGAVAQKSGYYTQNLLAAPIFCAIGAGLLTTLNPSSSVGHWVGYQILYGFGLGIGFQTSMLPAQAVLAKVDVAIGMALLFLTQQLGGAVFLAVAQNIFANKLIKLLLGVGGLGTNLIVNTGATDLSKIVPASELGAVLGAYNHALTRTFLVGTICSALAILGAIFVEWTSIKKPEEPKSVTTDVASDMEK